MIASGKRHQATPASRFSHQDDKAEITWEEVAETAKVRTDCCKDAVRPACERTESVAYRAATSQTRERAVRFGRFIQLQPE